MLKLDSTGHLLWDKTFGGSDEDWAESVIQTADGGFVVAGYTDSKGAGDYDFWVLKLDSTGHLLWDKTFGGSDSDSARSVVQTADGGLVVAGRTRQQRSGF